MDFVSLPRFTFNSNGMIELQLTDLPPTSEWVVEIRRKKVSVV